MTVLIFIIILGVLVFVHEFGHFIVAKKSGIRVDEFAIGFPPRLFTKKIGETNYSVNLIPFGGYVKIFGENPDDEALAGPDSKRSFVNKNRGLQALVLSAGIVFNVIFAWILFSGGFIIGLPVNLDDYAGSANIKDPRVIITDVRTDSPAMKAGLKAGDTIVSLEYGEDMVVKPFSRDVEEFVTTHPEKEMTVYYERLLEVASTTMIPISGIIEGRSAIGVVMTDAGTLKLPLLGALYEGAKLTYSLTINIVQGLGGFLYRAVTLQANFSEVSGPIGIAGLVGEARQLGLEYLISFTALISLNLAVINIFPFPALDGGRLLFVAIEAVTRRRIKSKIQNIVNGAGFAFLILLMILVTWNDIAKFF